MPAAPRDGPARREPVTGYTLSLSWAPEYCRGRKDSAADRLECSGDYGRFGLILHGLWPDSRSRPGPQWCPTTRRPTPGEVRANLCMTPSAKLLAHEWAKHGACMSPTPKRYFILASKLWTALSLPDLDRLSRGKALDAGKVRQAFIDVNPSLRSNQIGLLVNKRGWLKEVRLCYDRRFKPRRCAHSQLGPANAAPIKIWRGL